MAKFFGDIGYGESVETPTGSGVWKNVITEQAYFGDVITNTRKLEHGESLNDNISVGNSISVVADQYAVEHFFAIQYVRWMDILWKVDKVTVNSPRLILSLGDVYNGPVAQMTVTDNGDGSWTLNGPSHNIFTNEDQSFEVQNANATYLDGDTYQLSSDEE